MPVILKYRDSAGTTQSFENGAYTRLKTRDGHDVNIHETSPCAYEFEKNSFHSSAPLLILYYVLLAPSAN